MNENSNDPIVCRCEEVTESEVVQAIENGHTTMKEIKRVTRVGMGLCQGRICSEQIRRIIAEHTDKNIEDINPDKTRFPISPVKISNLETRNKKGEIICSGKPT